MTSRRLHHYMFWCLSWMGMGLLASWVDLSAAGDRPVAPGLGEGALGQGAGLQTHTSPRLEPPTWGLLLSPVFGWLQNKTDCHIHIPEKGAGYQEKELHLSGAGWGSGLLFTGFHRWFALFNVFYYYPDVNHSQMWGNITMVKATWPGSFWIRPYLGLGIAYIATDSSLSDYRYQTSSILSDGTKTLAEARFSELNMKTSSLQPLPEIGLTVDLPIQHWQFRAHYQYLYERISGKARVPEGTVSVYQEQSGEKLYDIPISFEKSSLSEYHSQVFGAGLHLDFRYFLRLAGDVTYNATHKLLSTRWIGTAMLSEHVGLSAYVEYQNMIVVDNTYVMLGLTFYQFPTEFYQQLRELRGGQRR